LILNGPLFAYTIEFIERYMSPDHHVMAATIAIIHGQLTLCGALLLAAGILITIWADAFSKTISRLVALFRNLTSRRFSIALLCGSFLTGLVLVISWYLRESPGIRGLYGEDRFLETATAVLFVCSAALLAVAAIRYRRRPIAHLNVVAALLATLGVVLFVMGMEEISWGQRLFHWATPAALQQVNDQGETNFHNISNALLAPLYRWGTVALMVLIAASWLWLSRRSKTVLRFLIPHVATLGILVPIFLFGAVRLYGELLEELGAAFALFYALAVLRASRHPIHTE
jgi:branched-subunit amino acid ABC-type transport system permease component